MATAHACLIWQVRYAMLGQLKSPANDLADVVKMHFKMRKGPILEQAISATSRRHLGETLCVLSDGSSAIPSHMSSATYS